MKAQPKSICGLKVRLLLATLGLLLIWSSCNEYCSDCGGSDTIPTKPAESFQIGEQGGIIHALSGNITLVIPKAALDEVVNLVINEGPIDYDGDFVIKSIEISPKTLLFKTPVGLSLKYDGQLHCDNDPCSAKSLVIYHFKNDKDFDLRTPTNMLWIAKCYLNHMDCCIETQIQSGGIYAIGEEALGQPAFYHH